MIPSRMIRACLLFALALSPLAAEAAGLPGYILIRYAVVDNRYVLHCTLNGKPLNLLIDSGASISVIDKTAFESAIPKEERVVPKGFPAKTMANGLSLPVYLAKNLQAGSMKFGDGPVLVYDFSRTNTFARLYGRYTPNEHVIVDGLIGLDILKTYGALIDTSRRILYLNPSRSKKGGVLSDNMKSFGYTRVRMNMDRHGNLEAPCSLQGKPGNLIVDTGAYLSQLEFRYARSAGVTMRPSSSVGAGHGMRMGLGVGGGGNSELFIAEPSSFKVGDYTFPTAPIGVLQHEMTTSGFLGPELLEKAHAFIDFGSSSLFLK